MNKILIMDDSKLLRTQMRDFLVEQGYEVFEAFDGQDAWEQLSSGSLVPDLMLLDVNTPRMDGIQLCEKIHESGSFSKTPIFLVTTESNPSLKEKAKLFGVKAWILKPFVPEKLASAINKILGK